MQQLPFLKGVNLGGWLITERWMTPSLYEGTDAPDEFSFLQSPDNVEKLRRHHRKFITKEDFAWLQEHRINALRIPVGYWTFGGNPQFISSIDYLDWAIEQAKQYDLFVLIDLHGAPGSQNGKDHSGRQGKVNWYQKANQEKTIEVLVRLAQRYRAEKHVFGVQLLNEPKPDFLTMKLRRFYNNAYQELVKVARPGLYIVFHDAFRPQSFSGVIQNPHPDFPVMLDNHHYGFFSDITAKILPIEKYFERLEARQALYKTLQEKQKIIIGEWSFVLSANILENRKDEEVELMARHGHIQKQVFESSTSGWFYWSYKTESPGIWSFRSLVENGLLTV